MHHLPAFDCYLIMFSLLTKKKVHSVGEQTWKEVILLKQAGGCEK